MNKQIYIACLREIFGPAGTLANSLQIETKIRFQMDSIRVKVDSQEILVYPVFEFALDYENSWDGVCFRLDHEDGQPFAAASSWLDNTVRSQVTRVFDLLPGVEHRLYLDIADRLDVLFNDIHGGS